MGGYRVRRRSLCVDGDLLFAASGSVVVQWHRLTGKRLATLTPKGIEAGGGEDQFQIWTVCARGGYLYSGSSDNHIRQWDIRGAQAGMEAHNLPLCRSLSLSSILPFDKFAASFLILDSLAVR